MRILYLSASVLPPVKANGIHVENMSKALAELSSDVRLHGIQSEDLSVASSLTLSHRVRFVGFKRGRFKVISSVVFGLRSVIRGRSFRADLVYARCLYSAYFQSFIDRPLVYESHHPPQTAFHRRLERKVLMSKNCVLHVVITEALKDHYKKIDLNARRPRILVAPDAARSPCVGNAGDAWSRPTRSKTGPFVAGYFGSAYPGKGLELVVALARKAPVIMFKVFGADTKDVSELAGGLPSNVVCFGRIDHEQVSFEMQRCDCLLLPNQKEVKVERGLDIGGYTSPLKMFEYMAARRPMIASNLPVLREVLQDGVNSVLADPSNPGEWYVAVEKIRDNPEWADELAENAFQELLKHYTWNARAKRILGAIGMDAVDRVGSR